ncbi:MAG TPA: hypothetical protein VNO50_10785 [Pyrinomonadaceae bacterium]|nr:hypothetical protein [Pyrinomonadaceae bacterium]
MIENLAPLWNALSGHQDWIVAAFTWIGVARVIFKVLFSMLGDLVKKTPSDRDDAFVDGLMRSNIYAAIAFLLDWILSIKLPQVEAPARR